MKERDRDPGLPAHAREPDLGLAERPVGREIAAVLVGIGIADHDLLGAALARYRAFYDRDRQQFPHDRRRLLQIVDGFKQRRHGQAAIIRAVFTRKQPAITGQQIHAQDIVDRLGHAQDEVAQRLPIQPVDHPGAHLKQAQGGGRRLVQSGEGRQIGQRPC